MAPPAFINIVTVVFVCCRLWHIGLHCHLEKQKRA
jgi:hypothetical protein